MVPTSRQPLHGLGSTYGNGSSKQRVLRVPPWTSTIRSRSLSLYRCECSSLATSQTQASPFNLQPRFLAKRPCKWHQQVLPAQFCRLGSRGSSSSNSVSCNRRNSRSSAVGRGAATQAELLGGQVAQWSTLSAL